MARMLTTDDNPFDPFTQYDEWYAYDAYLGYNTPGLLARYSTVALELSVYDQNQLIDEAMQKIVDQNFSGHHMIVDDGIEEVELEPLQNF